MREHVSDKELMKIQVEALFTQDKNGRLQHINEPIGATGNQHLVSSLDTPTKVQYVGSGMTSPTM